MDIVLYLTALLETRKMVGIAGLGTLYKKKIPGRYDADKHAFVPPSFTLSFTSDLKESEELANYISQDRHISLESANYFINEFADRILAQLANHHEANLPGIGLLKVGDNELLLIPNDESDLGKETYGLPTVADTYPILAVDKTTNKVDENKLEEIEQENKIEEENPGSSTLEEDSKHDDQPVYEEIAEVNQHHKTWEMERNTPPPIETAEQEEPVEEVVMTSKTTVEKVVTPSPIDYREAPVEIDETPKSTRSILVKVLIILAVILLAGAIAYFVNPKFFENYIQNNHQETPRKVPIVANDSLDTKVDSPNVKKVATDTTKSEAIKQTSGIDSTKMYYEVIGTSYKTKAAADKYIEKLARVGIKATIADMPGKRFNVSLGTFDETAPAYKLRDSLRTSLKNKEIYIQSIKPKTQQK